MPDENIHALALAMLKVKGVQHAMATNGNAGRGSGGEEPWPDAMTANSSPKFENYSASGHDVSTVCMAPAEVSSLRTISTFPA